MKPLVTVAIPVYNGKRYIHESIQSVLDQTFADFELIITDDGSTDGTMEIVRTFQDPRIRVVADGVHKGLAIRLNEQIADARGVFFARMDADDVMMPLRLERQVQFMREHPETDVVGSAAEVIDEDGRAIGYRNFGRWKRGAGRKSGTDGFERVLSFMHPTVMGKTEWFRNYYYNPACEGCEDKDLWLRSRNQSCFYSLCEPLLRYRDAQRFNLDTYLYRQEKSRYVLTLNEATIGWRQSFVGHCACRIKSMTAILLNALGRTDLLLKARNHDHSMLNNHVLHVITSLRTGGAEKLMVDLLPRLQAMGNEVEIVVFDGLRTPFYEELEHLGVKIHSFNVEGSVYNPLHILRLRRLMKEADVVHTHNTSPQLFAAVANIGVGARLITTEHNTSNRRRGKSWLKPFDCWMYKQYERIVCISDQAAENLGHYLPDIADKLRTIYNGIDISRFREGYGLRNGNQSFENKSGYIITMVAAFREQKDQKTLIRAAALLPEDYQVRLIGGGEARLIEECKRLAADLGIANRVSFLGVRSDIPVMLAEADVVVLSSHFEGLSLSSLEGMACGRPFVASDVDGLHEIVDGYGVLVPHEDPEAMAQAIKKLIEDPEYAHSVAKRCQERAAQFDIEVMAERYNELYSAED